MSDPSDRPSFELAQRRMQRRRPLPPGAEVLALVAFDLLWHDQHGGSLLARPYVERRARLEKLAGRLPAPHWQVGSSDPDVDAMMAAATELELEGLMLKRAGSVYRPVRSPDWLKLYTVRTLVATVGGFVPGPGGLSRPSSSAYRTRSLRLAAGCTTRRTWTWA